MDMKKANIDARLNDEVGQEVNGVLFMPY